MIKPCACLRAQPGFISPNDQSAISSQRPPLRPSVLVTLVPPVQVSRPAAGAGKVCPRRGRSRLSGGRVCCGADVQSCALTIWTSCWLYSTAQIAVAAAGCRVRGYRGRRHVHRRHHRVLLPNGQADQDRARIEDDFGAGIRHFTAIHGKEQRPEAPSTGSSRPPVVLHGRPRMTGLIA